MFKSRFLSQSTWLVVALSLSPFSFAHAYLDPGSGSYAIQVAIGLIVGASYTFKSFGGRITTWLRNRGKKSTDIHE